MQDSITSQPSGKNCTKDLVDRQSKVDFSLHIITSSKADTTPTIKDKPDRTTPSSSHMSLVNIPYHIFL
jgi:N-acetylmuramoyl-L-alanine amidase CwlA